MNPNNKAADNYHDAGPLAAVLGSRNVQARILDQSMIIGNMEFTVPSMAEATGLNGREVSKYIRHLTKIGWVKRSKLSAEGRKYRFDMAKMRGFIHWANVFQLGRRE